ncbi:MAG TPA: TonB-dependent receptor [Chitinophagaceae bacterium]|nr:TonB-dependent receptor [Chitinophagaceae bacterium]
MCLLLLVSPSIAVLAQETTAEISGVVKASDNNGITGAVVTAVHQPTGTKYVTTTRKDGRYNLPNLRVGGPYEITVSYVGYNTQQKNNITLSLGQEFKVDFELVAASTNLAEVVVKSGRSDKIFNNGRTGSQEVITRTQLDRLPTINRSLSDFTKLTPSANGQSFGGRSGAYNNITVDGANFNNAFGLSSLLGGQTNSQPISLDAIEQIQVNIAPFDVRQGGFSGAGVNSVTKSGTNEFKGTIYTYQKSPDLVGRRAKQFEVLKQNFIYDQYGAAIGGPIIKNKLFFFVSGEIERIEEPGTSLQAARGATTGGVGNISRARAEELDELRNFLIQRFGYNPGSYEGYDLRTQSDKLTAKVDWNINKSNVLTVKYNYLKSFRDVPASNSGAPTGGRGAGLDGLPFTSSFYTINNNFNIVIAELNTRFGNKASNKLQIGYTALRDFRVSLGGRDFPLVDIENGQGRFLTSFGYEPFTYNNQLNTDIYQLNDIFTYYLGKHELVVGTQNNIKKFKNGFAPNYNGTFRFRSIQDFYNSVNNGTANAIRYELRYSALKDGAFPFANVGAVELGFFIQDKWRIKDNLTITYGLRIDAPIFDESFDFNSNVANLTFRNGEKYSTSQAPKNALLWSPRLGVNWDVKGDKTTQLRGGVGLFAGPPPFVWISNQASNNGVQFGSFVLQPGVGGVAANDPRFVFNQNVDAYRPVNASANTAYNLVFTDGSFKYPQVFRADVALDQKLPWGLVGTLEYTFNKDINAVYFQNVNLPSTGAVLAGPDSRVRYTSPQIYASIPANQGGNTAVSPNISDAILMKNSNKGYAYVLTAQVQKNTNNFFGSIAYTFSEAKSINDGGSIAQSMWRDRPVTNDPNTDQLGFANFYQPHRVIAQASYQVSYAKHFATSIGLIFEASSGNTGSYVYNGDVNSDGLLTNDLMYIPRNSSEIVLERVNASDPRTPAQIWAQLDAYINQDWYLSRNRGEYAERNAAIAPFFKRLDLNITQDFSVKIGKQRNTIRLTFDIINFGNLVNRRWGVQQVFNRTSPLNFLRVETTGANAGRPVFSFPYLDPTNQIPLVNSYRDNTGAASRWQGQVGVRYLFNN